MSGISYLRTWEWRNAIEKIRLPFEGNRKKNTQFFFININIQKFIRISSNPISLKINNL